MTDALGEFTILLGAALVFVLLFRKLGLGLCWAIWWRGHWSARKGSAWLAVVKASYSSLS